MSNTHSSNEAAAARRDVCKQLFERARADVPAWAVELGLDGKYMATLDELEPEMLARMDALVTDTPVSASSRSVGKASTLSVEQLLEHSVLEGQNVLEVWNMVQRVRAHCERLHANGAKARAAFYEAAAAQLIASHEESIRCLREYQDLLGHPAPRMPIARSSKRGLASEEEKALACDLDRAPRDLASLVTMKSFSLRLMAQAAGLMDTAEQKIAWHDIKDQEQRARYVLAGVLRWDYLRHRCSAAAQK